VFYDAFVSGETWARIIEAYRQKELGTDPETPQNPGRNGRTPDD
jgi:hypothetical protein